MTIIDDEQDRMVGAPVLSRADERLGEVRDVVLDDRTHRPTWACVDLLGSEIYVPLERVDWVDRALHLALDGTTAPDTSGFTDAIRPQAGQGDDAVSYSVHDDAPTDEPEVEAQEERLGEAMREAEDAPPPSVSGHMLDE